MRRYGALLLTVLLVAGCGNGSGAAGDEYKDARSVAQAAGCGHFRTAPMNPGATDTGECTYHGHLVGVDWFKGPTGMNQFRELNDALGGEVILYGSNWALSCYEAKADCTDLHGRIGGTLK